MTSPHFPRKLHRSRWQAGGAGWASGPRQPPRLGLRRGPGFRRDFTRLPGAGVGPGQRGRAHFATADAARVAAGLGGCPAVSAARRWDPDSRGGCEEMRQGRARGGPRERAPAGPGSLFTASLGLTSTDESWRGASCAARNPVPRIGNCRSSTGQVRPTSGASDRQVHMLGRRGSDREQCAQCAAEGLRALRPVLQGRHWPLGALCAWGIVAQAARPRAVRR